MTIPTTVKPRYKRVPVTSIGCVGCIARGSGHQLCGRLPDCIPKGKRYIFIQVNKEQS